MSEHLGLEFQLFGSQFRKEANVASSSDVLTDDRMLTEVLLVELFIVIVERILQGLLKSLHHPADLVRRDIIGVRADPICASKSRSAQRGHLPFPADPPIIPSRFPFPISGEWGWWRWGIRMHCLYNSICTAQWPTLGS